jgi:aminomuconate-semialdehyde/2-hydroxymuconate-6-semialdehyde dehydrogenase
VGHRDIKAISFTGGTKTGEEIARTAAPMFKKLSLELGGKNPNIIFADCNYDEMLETTVRSSFANQGQICLCGSRIFIERPIYEKFKSDLVSRAMELNIGDPLKDSTNIGAVVSRPHMEKIQSYIDLARTEGGKILCGGNRVSFGWPLLRRFFLRADGYRRSRRTTAERIRKRSSAPSSRSCRSTPRTKF